MWLLKEPTWSYFFSFHCHAQQPPGSGSPGGLREMFPPTPRCKSMSKSNSCLITTSIYTCTRWIILQMPACAAVSVRNILKHTLIIMGMLTRTLPLLVSELSPDTRVLTGSQTQICFCSCTVTLSSLGTFIQCDTETSVSSATMSLIPLGNEGFC